MGNNSYEEIEDNDMPLPGEEDNVIPNAYEDLNNKIHATETPVEKIDFEEEIILPLENVSNTQQESIYTPPVQTISENLELEDFELVIKKDGINLNNLKNEDVKFETINIPNNTILEMINFVDEDDAGSSILKKNINDVNSIGNIAKLLEEAKVREYKGVHEKDDNDHYYNAAKYKKDGKEVKMHPSFINTRSKNSSSGFMDNISKATNTDVVISVPLYNSGIWLGIQSPSEPEIIQLQMLALENEIKLGASTAGLVYSNYSVLFRKYALDLAFANIKYSSVKVENYSILRELIDSTDENSIINAVSAGIYPTGVDRMVTCKNFLREKNPCTHSVQTKLHFDRLHYIDYSRLDEEALLHMSKKTPNSTTIAEVERYKERLSKYKESIKTYKLPNGEDLIVNYKVPNIKNSIMQGEFWTEKITMVVNNIITNSNKNVAEISDEMMKIYLDSAMKTNLLGMYLHFISSMTISGETETDYREINNVLSKLTKIDNIAAAMINDITDLIKNSSLTIIGQTQYTCPKCKEVNDNNTVEAGHPFKKIIPFNVLGVLFILGSLKYSTVILRKE